MIRSESAGGVVINNKGFILIVNQYGTSWSLPKGHIEGGETKVDAAKREIYEESGIKDLDLIKELGDYQRFKIDKNGNEDRSEFKTIYMFLFKTSEDILKPVDPENPQAKWINKKEVVNILTHPKDKEFYLSVLNEI